MDRWAWSQLEPWLAVRRELPVGALLCVIRGTTAGRHWEPTSARKQLRRTAARAGVRRRFAPHQLRHAHAVEMAHEGVPLVVIQRQLGHANLGVTSIYLQGIDSSEIINTVHSRPAPVISVTSGLTQKLYLPERTGWALRSPPRLPREGGHAPGDARYASRHESESRPSRRSHCAVPQERPCRDLRACVRLLLDAEVGAGRTS
jgi:hypothetical protein